MFLLPLVTPSILMFSLTLLISTLMVASSNSIFISWVALELNSLSFIPMIFLYSSDESKTLLGESALKYFLVQTFGSVLLITSSLLNNLDFIEMYLAADLMMIALLIKLGVAPFHSWSISVGAGVSWQTFFVLMTIQKVNPFLILMCLPLETDLILVAVVLSLLMGALGGLVQTNFKALLVYSSVNHLGWLIVATMISMKLFLLYFLIYALALYVPVIVANLTIIDDVADAACHEEPILHQCLMGASILSLAGLPPFLGFLPKWFVLQELMISGAVMIPLVMILCSVVMLYFYLRVGFSTIILSSLPASWEDDEEKIGYKRFYFLFPIGLVLTCGGLPLAFMF